MLLQVCQRALCEVPYVTNYAEDAIHRVAEHRKHRREAPATSGYNRNPALEQACLTVAREPQSP
jgi:hypothetical protein